VEQYLASAGWTVVQRQSWRAMAAAYGWTPEPSRFRPPAPPALPDSGNDAAATGSGAGGGASGAGDAPSLPPELEVQFVVATRTF
ncbi:hypothetical protein MNEG_16659, partial [Monoraphidium neglectum]